VSCHFDLMRLAFASTIALTCSRVRQTADHPDDAIVFVARGLSAGFMQALCLRYKNGDVALLPLFLLLRFLPWKETQEQKKG
jgi:hypothetical protein